MAGIAVRAFFDAAPKVTLLPDVPIQGTIEPNMGTRTPGDYVADVLFGSTRRQVLTLLLGRPDERFYLREILRAVGGGSGALQRELRQLTEAGIVNRESRGPHVYFSANQQAPIFSELQAIIEKTAGTIDVLRSCLASMLSAGRIQIAFVYGSVATGKQTAASDVDLMTVGDVTLSEMVTALQRAEDRLGREVNASVYPPREFRQRFKRGAPFLKRVVAGPKLFVTGSQRELARLYR